jgi:glycosyltransferase involved in cell wall biosynthesis
MTSPTHSRQPLSAVVITLNCASQLQACLESVAFADEVLVVDSGSTDGTVALAQGCGARVIHQEWLGFGPQKQFAAEQAQHDWVLSIDSDERVTPELRASIERALALPEFRAYQFPRCNRFMGRYLRHGEGYPDLGVRLFDRRHARWSDDAVHERVINLAAVGRLEGDLLHESAESLEAYLAKQNRYTTLSAETMLREGRRATPARMLLSPIVRFVKFYLLRKGFLDGVPGLVHTLIGCQNSFVKYAKALDGTRREGEGR